MSQNPYDSSIFPTDGNATRGSVAKDAGLGASITIGAMIGGLVGMVSYIAGGLFVELFVVPQLIAPNTPRLAYGQQAGMIMAPLAGLFGIGLGVTIVLCLIGRRFAGGVLGLFSALVVTSIIASMWRSQVTTYGRDVSEAVLFAPFLPHTLLAIVLGTIYIMRPRKAKSCVENDASKTA